MELEEEYEKTVLTIHRRKYLTYEEINLHLVQGSIVHQPYEGYPSTQPRYSMT